ncbi:TonB-dependent receptor plug domain-containing protein [Galbibacter mesophilus]|uniref:TonB-dependent receptor plug domain-containing protein n=1 Tax=Galbibacter mesophilus TaxID=379069 RepID=UPI001F5C869E|nr:TonB-dependent receptor [Galbibacter mesophilus]MCM5663424.1 TonB-dependent receptor [Galbibacter mesophilus]
MILKIPNNSFFWLALMGICLGFFPNNVFGQLKIKGNIAAYNDQKAPFPLSGAKIYWLQGNNETISDSEGDFSIPFSKASKRIIISYPNFRNDTLLVNRPDLGRIILFPEIALEAVIVEENVNPLQRSLFDVQNVVTVDSREMLKAACCNLSESFETNPSVDVNISDAATGAKQIQMLGLNSPYLLFTQENMPSIRGASQVYGLSFIPGSWIESIQITKGTGSVLNGFESITGQINSELVKPFIDKEWFLNFYGNSYARFELNARHNADISEKWATGIYLHANKRTAKVDENEDNFLDTPLAQQINFMNRWQYSDAEKGWVGFFNVQYLFDEKQTGEINFNPDKDKFTENTWGSEVQTNRIDVSSKVGYVFPDLPFQSFGLQLAFSNHDQNSYYGFRTYDIQQQSFYSNAIFNSIIGSTQHKYKTGISFTYDGFQESINTQNYNRKDNSIGAFFEYTYNNLEKLSFVAGIRIDNHNRLHTFLTPRLHLRYALWDKANIRASIGRGKRSANIFAENQQLFSSNRQIIIENSEGSTYGLSPETAWNYGISFTQKLYLWNRTLVFSTDFYRTDFVDQVVVDWENPQAVSFYNLDGSSFANSFQIDINYELIQNVNLRATYKNYQVKTNYQSGNLQKPFQPEHRFFVNANYETVKQPSGRQWRFDATLNWLGKQRLPNTQSNPEIYRVEESSPSYSILNAQITYSFTNKFEIYAGGENINNYTQPNPILASDDPFGEYFDSTLSYAPVLGGVYYVGFRFKIQRQ